MIIPVRCFTCGKVRCPFVDNWNTMYVFTTVYIHTLCR